MGPSEGSLAQTIGLRSGAHDSIICFEEGGRHKPFFRIQSILFPLRSISQPHSPHVHPPHKAWRTFCAFRYLGNWVWQLGQFLGFAKAAISTTASPPATPPTTPPTMAEVPMSPINVIIVKFHAGDKCRNKQISNLSFVNKGNLFQPRLSKKFTTNCIWRWQTSGNRVVGARFKDDSKAGSADALRLPTDDTTWVCRK